jgi:2',3'-cyclic-nucleotide 2'-phosphodiesterase (5'-nucleotidase family)
MTGVFCASLLALALAAPAAAEPVKLSLLHINDIDRIEDSKGRGGLARLMTLVNRERAAAEHAIFTHGGDTISPSLLAGFDKGAHIIDLLNEAELDIMVLGNHEFDFGPAVTRQRISEARFPILGANAVDTTGTLIEGTLATWTKEVGPYTVGFIGLTTPETPEISTTDGVTFNPLVQTARELSDNLRRNGADLIVALAHTGIREDLQLVNEDSGIDVLLSGHDHLQITYYNGQRAFVEAGSQGETLMVVELTMDTVDDRGEQEFVWSPQFRILSTQDVEPDAVMAAKVQTYLDQLSKELDVALGKSVTPLDSQRAAIRTSETAIGNLIADAIREGVDADVAITNGGGIRGDKTYEAGVMLTRRDIQSELPFGNRTVKLQMTGAQLLDALEHGVSAVEEGAGRFPHVSGITMTWSRSASPGERVKSVSVNGKPLDPMATYTVATNDFIAGGGDGYAVLTETKSLIDGDAAQYMASMVMDFVAAAGEVAPKIEGRVKAVD